MDELKPCPFCGEHSARLVKVSGWWKVYCDNGWDWCQATMGYQLSEQDATTAWNTRKDDNG